MVEGRGANDVICADTLSQVLNKRPVPNTFSYLVKILRSVWGGNSKAVSPLKTNQVTTGGLQSTSFKRIIYTTVDGNKVAPSHIEMWKQSQLGGLPEKIINIPPLWSHIPEISKQLIIPKVTVAHISQQTTPLTDAGAKVVQTRDLKQAATVAKDAAATLVTERIAASQKALLLARTEKAAAQGVFVCTKPGCNKEHTSEYWLQEHISKRECRLTGDPHSSNGHGIVPTEYNVLEFDELVYTAMLEETEGWNLERLQQQAQAELVNSPSIFKYGWAVRQALNHPPLTAEWVAFLKWCWDYGEVEANSKISPEKVAILATLHGTNEGHHLYPDDGYWKANTNGTRTFSSNFLILEPWRIKQAYGTMSTNSKKNKPPLVQSGQ